MKETIFEIKEVERKENIEYNFQPNQHFEAIKSAIIKRFKQKKILIKEIDRELSEPPYSPFHLHLGGLPSPPVEEKKISIELDVPSIDSKTTPCTKTNEPLLSSGEIRDKIRFLEEEKHQLFQLMKQKMVQEESKKREQQQQQQQEEEQQRQQQRQRQQQQRKKSRWSPATPETPTFNNNSSYFYPRPRFSPYQPRPRQQQQQQQHHHRHHSLSRPPFSR